MILEVQNKDYATAIAYEKIQQYGLALLSYEKALVEARDQVQKTQILIKIALMTERSGDYIGAIVKFKTIAADTSNYAMARAYAVQEMGLMNLYIKNSRQVIFTETFKDSPYDSLKTDGNLNLTYTKLFEYAAKLYPLGYSEAYVAYGYADEIVNTLLGATTTTQGVEYLSFIKKSMDAADADILRMKAVPGEATLVPEALVRQGRALGLLASVGSADSEQAESYFKEGLAYDALRGNKAGSFNTFHYAAFLVDQYGSTRSDDIKKLLSPFRVSNTTAVYSNIIDFYRKARTDITLIKNKKQLVIMSQIDPDFKTYLLSLDWTTSDFK